MKKIKTQNRLVCLCGDALQVNKAASTNEYYYTEPCENCGRKYIIIKTR